jgi:hypothetical protein
MSKLTTIEKIRLHLLNHNISEQVVIEKEVEEVLLNFLESADLEMVYLDDGALMFEFNDNPTAPNMTDVISTIEDNK